MYYRHVDFIFLILPFFLNLSENLLSLKRFSKHKIRSLGKESLVLKEKNLMKSLSPSAGVPQVLCTCVDQTHAGIMLNTCIACPIASILYTPLDWWSICSILYCLCCCFLRRSTKGLFSTIDAIIDIPFLHQYWLWKGKNILYLFEFQNGVLYRGVSPDVSNV